MPLSKEERDALAAPIFDPEAYEQERKALQGSGTLVALEDVSEILENGDFTEIILRSLRRILTRKDLYVGDYFLAILKDGRV